MGKMIEFDGAGTSYSGYLAPSEKGTGPGVIVIHEWWGLVDHIKAVADRFAQNGFTALAVDCFHGKQTEDPDEAEALMMAFGMTEAEGMIDGAVGALLANEATTGQKVGTVGFSMGGQVSLLAGCTCQNVRACVTNYGVNPNLHPKFTDLHAPVLGIYAELDLYIFGAQISMLDLQLVELKKEHFFKTYEGCHHGFFNSDRPDVYDEVASEDAWTHILKFFRHHLA